MLVVADGRAVNAKVVQETARMPGIFAGNQICFLENPQGA